MQSGERADAAGRHACAAGVCPGRGAEKWNSRVIIQKAPPDLADRSSRPRTLDRPTQLLIVDAIIAPAPSSCKDKQIAMRATGVLPATVSRVLKRAGLNPHEGPQIGRACAP